MNSSMSFGRARGLGQISRGRVSNAFSARRVPVVRPLRAFVPKASSIARPESLVVSPHPDALRRRREAEERARERRRAVEYTVESLNGRSFGDSLGNVFDIDCASELDFRISSRSRGNRLVVTHYKAAWCGACARMQYKLKQIAKQNPDVTFLIVDLAKDKDLLSNSAEMGIDRLPYFMFYKSGKCVSEFTCNLTNISVLRAEVAAHKNTGKEEPDVPIYAHCEN